MRVTRSALALDPRLFGRREPFTSAPEARPVSIGDDLRLFAATFVGGFLFVSILIV